MKTKINLIEKIEGEAKLHLKYKENRVISAEIEFFNSRNIEGILNSKPALDALVINTRVCGICGHAHLIATTRALESIYNEIEIPENAKILREITLNLEIIQNHFKWLYLTVMPLVGIKGKTLKFINPNRVLTEAIAAVAGQYPHNSYSIVGGVVCKLSSIDIVRVKNHLLKALSIFKKEVIELSECGDFNRVIEAQGDLAEVVKEMERLNLLNIGRSYGRFIAFGKSSISKRGRFEDNKIFRDIDLSAIKEFSSKNSLAKSIHYNGRHYEVGSLARAIISEDIEISNIYQSFADSNLTRLLARVCEIPKLLKINLKLLDRLNLKKPFYIKPKIEISKVTGDGVGLVEAARGSLIHKVSLENGIIRDYSIITPTQWNLGNGVDNNLGVAQKAIINSKNDLEAEIIFKIFDVCSVCTTH